MNTNKIYIILFVLCSIMMSCSQDKKPNTVEEKLSLIINNNIIDDDIKMIFYGVTLDQDSIMFKNIPQLIIFENETNKKFDLFLFYVHVQTFVPIKFSKYYKIIQQIETKLDSVTTQYDYELCWTTFHLSPYERIPFPLTEAKVADHDNIIRLNIQYGRLGNEDPTKTLSINILLYPTNRGDKSINRAESEYTFLEHSRFLMDWQEPEQTTLVFDSVIVPRLTNHQLLAPNDFKVRHLKELLDDK